jgi:hypothetical protein
LRGLGGKESGMQKERRQQLKQSCAARLLWTHLRGIEETTLARAEGIQRRKK